MNIRNQIFALAAIALLGVAPLPAAYAQAQADAPAAQEEVIPNYSETELKTFAVAALEVQRINDAYLPMLQAAPTREEQEHVLQSAGNDMEQVLQKRGMSVVRFTQILHHAQLNEGLAKRVRQHIEEVR